MIGCAFKEQEFFKIKAWRIELVDGDIETRDYPQQEGRQSREAVNYSNPDDLEPSDKAPWE